MTGLLLWMMLAQDASETCRQAAQKTGEHPAYAFTITFREEDLPLDVDNEVRTVSLQGQAQKGGYLSAEMVRDKVIRKGDKTVYKVEDGGWKTFEELLEPPRPPTLEKTPPKKKKPSPVVLRLQALRPVGEEVQAFVGTLGKIREIGKEKAENQECVSYEGEVTPEEVIRFLKFPLDHLFEGVTAEAKSGSGRVWVNSEGRIVKYEGIYAGTVKFQARGKERAFTIQQTWTVTLEPLKEVTIEVPPEAKKKLEE